MSHACERQVQRGRAVVESNAVFGTEIFGKRLLKAFDRRPQDELAREAT